MRKETKCPYRRYIGPRVFKALGDYEHPLLSTLGVWVPEVEFVGGVACLMLHLLTPIIPIVYLFIGANFVSLPFALKMAYDDSRPLIENF